MNDPPCHPKDDEHLCETKIYRLYLILDTVAVAVDGLNNCSDVLYPHHFSTLVLLVSPALQFRSSTCSTVCSPRVSTQSSTPHMHHDNLIMATKRFSRAGLTLYYLSCDTLLCSPASTTPIYIDSSFTPFPFDYPL